MKNGKVIFNVEEFDNEFEKKNRNNKLKKIEKKLKEKIDQPKSEFRSQK